eukprot:5296471-Pyramimonas_sp.AAC.1
MRACLLPLVFLAHPTGNRRIPRLPGASHRRCQLAWGRGPNEIHYPILALKLSTSLPCDGRVRGMYNQSVALCSSLRHRGVINRSTLLLLLLTSLLLVPFLPPLPPRPSPPSPPRLLLPLTSPIPSYPSSASCLHVTREGRAMISAPRGSRPEWAQMRTVMVR